MYLPLSNWFGTKRMSVWFKINRKMVNIFWFWFDLIRLWKDFSLCRDATLSPMCDLFAVGPFPWPWTRVVRCSSHVCGNSPAKNHTFKTSYRHLSKLILFHGYFNWRDLVIFFTNIYRNVLFYYDCKDYPKLFIFRTYFCVCAYTEKNSYT